MARSQTMQARRRARELAVQLLYSLDNRSVSDAGPALELLWSEGGVAEDESPEVRDYLRFLALGAWSRRDESDSILLDVVTGWRPERMVSVDRAVLRLAVFEGFLERSVPFAVAISEAVDIAHSFGTDDSGRFVNGVLARVLRRLIPESEREKKRAPRTSPGKPDGRRRKEAKDDAPPQAGSLPADGR